MLKLQTILYELAIAIGNSFEEDANAKELIYVFIKRLSCKGALLIKGNHKVIFSFPKNAQKYKSEIFKHLNSDFKEEKMDEYYFYVYKLKGYGYFVFYRKDKLDFEIRKALFRVMDKFAKSLLSCEMYENMTEAFKKAKKAEKAKMQFLANMSHEIRTPLNGILGFTKILLKKDLNEDVKKTVQVIDSSSNQLLKIVNEILDISKIESKGIEFEIDEFDPLFEFENIVNLFGAKAQEKNLKYNVFIDPRLPVKIKGDKFRLNQVLSNLINNAIKFTESGEISVDIILKHITKHNCEIFFSIKDTGIGIPKDKQQKIFEMFTQVSESINRKYGGTGLGLAISSKIVEAMGGELKVKSEINKGSEFYFSLTFDIAQITNPLKDKLNDLDVLIYSKDFKKCELNLLKRYLQNLARVQVKEEMDLPVPNIYDAIFVCRSGYEELKDTYLDAPLVVVGDKAKYSLIYPFSISDVFNLFLDIKNIKKEHVIVENKDKKFKGKILIAEDNVINQELLKEFLRLKGKFEMIIANDGKEAINLYKENENIDLIFMDINMPKVSGIAAMYNIKEIEKNKKKKTPIIALTANTLKGDREKFLDKGFDDYLPKPFEEKDLDRVLHKYLQIYEDKNEPKKTNLKKTNSSLPPELLERLQNIFKNNIDEDMSGLIQAFKNNDFKNIFYYSHKIKGAAGNIGYEEIFELTKEIESLAKNNKKDEKLLQKLQQEIEKIKA